MNETKKIRKISICIFLIPLITLNLCLFVATNYHLFEDTIFVVDQLGRSGFTIPYFDGSVSISRTARTYPAYLIFKPAMLITAILLINYWIINNRIAQKISGTYNKNYLFLFFGYTSAIFLIAHTIFLGIKFDYDLYKFFRRFVLIGFILFEIIAQTLLVFFLFKRKNKIQKLVNKNILFLKIALVFILSIIAIGSIPILINSGNTQFKHALEWNYFMGVVTFYFLTFLFWKKKSN